MAGLYMHDCLVAVVVWLDLDGEQICCMEFGNDTPVRAMITRNN